MGRLNSAPPGDVAPARRVVAVVGITGAGKSATANTLAGRLHVPFASGASVTSVTRATSFRDYSFVNELWRVVDTPGLGDTNRPAADVSAELRALATLAPHGLTAVVVVVPHGRLTGAHEAALREVAALFGGRDALARAAVIAVTGAVDAPADGRGLMTRDALLGEIAALPLESYFRALCDTALVVPVENRFDPHRYYSRLALHQAVLACEAARGGKRVDVAGFASGGAGVPTAAEELASGAGELGARDLRPCTREVIERGKARFLRIECELRAL